MALNAQPRRLAAAAFDDALTADIARAHDPLVASIERLMSSAPASSKDPERVFAKPSSGAASSSDEAADAIREFGLSVSLPPEPRRPRREDSDQRDTINEMFRDFDARRGIRGDW